MRYPCLACASVLITLPVVAAIFGSVHVVVHDPQNLGIPNATIVLRAKASDWSQTAQTNSEGMLDFNAVPLGQYIITGSAAGFAKMAERPISVLSDTVTAVQLQLTMETVEESVTISDNGSSINAESSTTQTTTDRLEIARTPDADRSGSLAMITDNVPGTYVMHDHLHSRGGHGVGWQIDGVPVPNSNLATAGAQFDPKDVDYLEAQRGGYSTQYGDRAYGMFNVVPRTGFEGTRFGEFMATYGSFNQTNEYLSLGGHSDRFAYYGSASGMRTDRALERPDIPVLHDLGAAFSGFTSLIFNATAQDQLRFVGSVRRDHYQVPNTQEQQDMGIRDVENTTDAIASLSWVRTLGPGTLLTVSPYYHYNRGQYIGGPGDVPFIPQDDRISHYGGGYITFATTKGRHTARVGTDSFGQHDDSFFGITANDSTRRTLEQRELLPAGLTAVFAEDTYRATSWLTLNAGLRFERFTGTVTEHSIDPRAGAAIKIPHMAWVLRGSYGRYYQHPPLSTINGPLLEFALAQGFGFLPLKGERNEVWEVGLGIPIRGWTLDFSHFHNSARNVVDHQVLGNSNLLFPLAIANGRIRAWESTLRSPLLLRRVQLHWSFSNQTAQARGAVSGGLTDFQPPGNDYFYMDHDQRVTVVAGSEVHLPKRAWMSANVVYGSGFLKGNGPEHMPQHAVVDISLGKDLGESWSVRATALNVGNNQFLTGLDSAFAGTHYSNPREISVQVRHRFHF